MIQIMDIAFNNFNGKLSEKYFKTWERMMLGEDGDVSDFNLLPQRRIVSYYKDSVTITCKGQQQELVRILKVYKAIDFSSNFFEGQIPESLMDFKSIYILNFSNNGLTGEIPSSQITPWLVKFQWNWQECPSFLIWTSLSIISGTQLQSFQASCFEGNDGLYGPVYSCFW
ncbi:unnamed protein product [Vicia faba]|uniref:Uncharacterized protein n=1 Tax=Vicia faba TaxID=3906 RepID=A0AAV0ZSL4_VICFA|nr:unnamed protein product [Vicia faba]